MKSSRIFLFLFSISLLTSCASGYKMIQPRAISYVSSNEADGVKLEYKYNVLEKRYLKKETKKGIKIAAVKITNNSDREYTFGKDLRLEYGNGSQVNIISNKNVFSQVKQGTPIYLLYLLLTPLRLEVGGTNSSGFQETTSSTPIGLVVGPGLAAGNMIAAGSANKKFRTELNEYDLQGKTIKPGEVVFGIIGIDSDSNEALNLNLE